MAEKSSSGPKRAARASSKPSAAAAASTTGGAKPKRGKRKTGLLGKIARGLLIVILATMLAATVTGYIFYQRAELPDPNADFTTQTTRLYFRDGTTPLGSLAVQNRTNIAYADMPQSMKDAAIAAEDRSFWTNHGIDIRGMTRAVWNILRNQEITGGGSTITQQYIKIRYLTSEQTMSRKFTELALAIKMNKAETKESVLEGYLNTIYFGRGAYGIQAAARAFFQVDAKDLTIAQSATLAAILNSPSALDPANGDAARAALLDRYQYVLDGMLDPMGTITQAEHDQYYNQLPDFPEIPVDNVYGGPNGFLIRMAIDELEAKGFTPEQINGGGLTIVTTFDPRLQQAAIDAAESTVAEAVANARPIRDAQGNSVQPDPAQLHVGLASIAVGTGEVLALYGGPDFVTNSRNWATTPRYAASTFKVWGAVAGLRNGFGLSSTLQGSTYTPPGDSEPVHNDSGANYGTVTLLQSIRDSINTPFVDMMMRIPNGTEALIKAANDGGIPEHSSWAPQMNRLVLGEGEVTSLDNATGFATLANNGLRNETHVVTQVNDAAGKVIYTGNSEAVRAIEDAVARDVTYAISGAAAGSSVNAVGGRPVTGKTGTEGIAIGQGGSTVQVTRAGWLVGYTKQISTSVVMVAGEDGNQNLDPYAKPWMGTFYGAGYPTDVWDRYMAVATQGMDYVNFDPPANIQPTVQNTLPAGTPTGSALPSETPSEEPSPTEPAEPTTQPPTSSGPMSPVPPTTAPPPTTTATQPATTATTTASAPPPTTATEQPGGGQPTG